MVRYQGEGELYLGIALCDCNLIVDDGSFDF